jgi:hypothetical protein
MTMMPYRIRSHKVSERLRRGASAGRFAVELIYDLKNKTPLSCGDNGARGKVHVARRVAKLSDLAAVHKNLLEFYTEAIFCQRKNMGIKTILAKF